VIAYCLTGRSSNSKNRRIIQDGGRLYTDFADKSKGGDPSLVIYDVMRLSPENGVYTVSNGVQTETVHCAGEKAASSFEDALSGYKYEPDKPNWTPRITAQLVCFRNGAIEISMSSLQKSLGSGADEYRVFWADQQQHLLKDGIGMCLTTYDENTSPGVDVLPAFRGDPFPVTLVGSAEQIAERIWSGLNPDYRVSVAAAEIKIGVDAEEDALTSVHIINLHGDAPAGS
jgi:hypothetical protein